MKKKWITAVLTIAGLAVTAHADLVFTDNFNRDDGSLGSPWTIGNTAETEIISNQARCNVATPSPRVVGVNSTAFSATTEFEVSVDLTFVNNGASGLWFLGKSDTSAASGYFVRVNSATSVIMVGNITGPTTVNTPSWSGNSVTVGALSNSDIYRLTVASSVKGNSVDITFDNLTTPANLASFTATRGA